MYRVAVTFLTFVSIGLGSILDGDLDIVEGVRLVSIPVTNSLEDGARSFGGNTVLGRTAKFLQGHELMVRLPKLIEKDKLLEVFGEGLKVVDETAKNSKVTGRGKHGGGGGGAAALLGLLFAKALGAAGIGALGLLTMKALAVSALALLLSAIVGAKKMSHHDHDDHQVIYAGHHGHHRRKRDVETPLPYHGWLNYAPENSS